MPAFYKIFNLLQWVFFKTTLITALLFDMIDVSASQVSHRPETDQDAICGVWYTTNNNSKVEIFHKNGMYYGRVIWVKDPVKSVYANKVVILNMTYNHTSNNWDKGTLYYPVKDTQYKGYINLINSDTLSIRVYKGTPLIGKTITWLRVK